MRTLRGVRCVACIVAAAAMLPGMRPFIVALAFTISACSIPGENAQLGFELGLADVLYEFRSGDRVLLGTELCPHVAMATNDEGEQIVFVYDDEETALLACMDESLLGVAQFDAERCLQLDVPGELTWSLTATGACEWDSDQLRLTVAAPTPDLRAGFDAWRVRSSGAQAYHPDNEVTIRGLAPGRTLADLSEDPAAPRYVAAGQIDMPMLRFDDSLGRVWTDALPLALVGEGATIIEPVESEDIQDISEYALPNELPLVLEPGAVVRIRASLPSGEQLESPELIAVAPSAAASLDLVVADGGDELPTFAYAEVRDAEGRVLHAAPVEWSVASGALVVMPGALDNEGRSGEYAFIGMDGCEPPPAQPSERHAVLRARLGPFEDSVELTWTALPEQPDLFDDLPFEPDPSCMFGDDVDDGGNDEVGEAGVDDDQGCACTSGRESSPFASLALLGVLGLRRRRR